MSTVKRLVTSAAAILLVVSIVCAQEQTLASSRSTITVTAAATADRVRFTAPSTVVQMRIEVYASNGEKLFDNEIRGGNVIDWHLQDGQAERLSDGSYLCVVTSKSLSGRMSQKLGRITIENAAASVQPIDTTQLTAQQTQAVGPVEENTSLTVLKEGETQTGTIIAHNGTDGQLIRGRGALSFRIGDFFSGKDREQMRLTEEGNLGIGITNPQVRLDVDGVIRASQGIIFPDGTTQYSAASKTLGAKSTAPDQILGGKHKFQTESVTANHIAKFTDGGGTLGDSVITETAGGLLGIGTPSPDSLLNIQGTIPSLLGHMSVIRTTGSNNGFGLLMDATGSGNNNLGLAVGGVRKAAFSWDNSRHFLGFVNFNYSANDFSLRVNADGSLTYHDGVSSAELFRITAAGNVGIGTTTPATPLEVNGLVRSTRSGLAVQYIQLHGGDSGSIKLTAQSAVAAEKSLFIQNLSGEATPGVNNTIQFQVGTTASPSTKMIIDKDGNVGIGTTSPTSKLYVLSSTAGLSAIYGESASGRGVWGKSVGSRGVYGEADSGEGVHGQSNTGTGVFGLTAATNASFPGVYGASTGSGGVGVKGEANTSDGIGVYGTSTSATGYGVFANNPSGIALGVAGNATQSRDKGGLVKAMLYVKGDGTIARCFNSQLQDGGASLPPSGTTGCGFSILEHGPGGYFMDFGFKVNDRFFSLTIAEDYYLAGAVRFHNAFTGVITENQLEIDTYDVNRSFRDTAFYLIVY